MNQHIGSSFHDFLEEEGILVEVRATAIKRVIAWELQQKMETEGISKTRMAEMLSTNDQVLEQLLDPKDLSVTLTILDNAARMIGKTLKFDLVA